MRDITDDSFHYYPSMLTNHQYGVYTICITDRNFGPIRSSLLLPCCLFSLFVVVIQREHLSSSVILTNEGIIRVGTDGV